MLEHYGWMSWNLFLALVPLALSMWLFWQPRSRLLRWGTWGLLGATFWPAAPGVVSRLMRMGGDLGSSYWIGAVLLTVALMGFDSWQRPHHILRSPLWWLGFLAFVAFLPNAPYVLTDVIHLIDDIRQGDPDWLITLVHIPKYALFMFLGFQAYVLSLIHLGQYMQKQGWGKFIWVAELILHILTAVGIYIGRFQRFNSWDIITNPDALVITVMSDLIGKRPVVVMVVTLFVIGSLYWLMKIITLAVAERGGMTHSEVGQISPEAESTSKS
ncbi:MAG TPA: DUF1361 domain-containing protein [Oscillatoriaceae cyanobacterium M33_DOE_052]|uniref:DUF1361 domain-containing protein n=1 Tax=Planktothricoides sp. SpSt-374 TaxID=2282167 RepID=A0A7C3ZLI1_9CYAN|nr:DUF1361 domain-containing protein [Oscillatoriaceae cyanobacterium M33_DOE_052]